MNCLSCGSEITGRSIVCPTCGKVYREHYPEFEVESFNQEIDVCAERMLRYISKSYDLSKYAWDKEVQRYAGIMTKTRDILVGDNFSAKAININNYLEIIDEFLKKCSNAEFQIALIGAVKAGKSTLMNAITGCEVASTAVTPETASLTKFRSSKTGENYVNVKFYKSESWDKLWNSVKSGKGTVFVEEYNKLNADSVKNKWLDHEPISKSFKDFDEFTAEITKWTSSRAPEHYFVDEVEIGLASLDMPPEVVFVDTPGLDDPVEYRSQITQSYIRRADAVIVCVSVPALSGSALKTISDVFAYSRNTPQKVYISATKCDTLNQPLSEWEYVYEKWIEHLEKSQYYNSPELARRNIIPTAAGFYNVLKKLDDPFLRRKIEGDDTFYMAFSMLIKYKCCTMKEFDAPETHKKLYNYTGINTIKERLKSEIIDKRKQILAREIHSKYLICADEIRKALGREIEGNLDTISNLKKSREELLKQSELKRSELANFEHEKERMQDDLNELLKKTYYSMNELIKKIKNMSANSDDLI